MKKLQLSIPYEAAGQRIDIQASGMSGLTRSLIQRLIKNGLLTVNGHSVRQNYTTKAGDVLYIIIPQDDERLTPEDIPIEVLYLDAYLIVVNKPPDMVVYPAAGHSSGTLMNAVAYHSKKLSSVGGPLRPGVVHRIDRETSGILVVALEDFAYYNLVEQFRKRTVRRKYSALVYGNLKGDTGEISLRIGRSESDRKKMSTRIKRGKEAMTSWKTLERFEKATLVEVRLGTGRTHQIRVHFASIGHPVLGDKTYGNKTSVETGRKRLIFTRQMLHAELLGFLHPVTGRYMEFTCPPPADMEEMLKRLRESP